MNGVNRWIDSYCKNSKQDKHRKMTKNAVEYYGIDEPQKR